MLKIFLLVTFLSSLSTQASALDMSAQGVYQATKEACSSLSEEELRTPNLQMDKLRAGYFPSKDFNEILNAIRRQGVEEIVSHTNFSRPGSYAKYILESPEFEQALTDCYSDSRAPKKFFRDTIVRSDHAGKGVGITIELLLFKGVNLGIAGAALKVKSWSHSVYQAFQFSSKAFMGLSLVSLLHSDSPETEQIQEIKLNLNPQNTNLAESNIMSDESFRQSLNSLLLLNQSELKKLTANLEKETDEKKRNVLIKKISAKKKIIQEISST